MANRKSAPNTDNDSDLLANAIPSPLTSVNAVGNGKPSELAAATSGAALLSRGTPERFEIPELGIFVYLLPPPPKAVLRYSESSGTDDDKQAMTELVASAIVDADRKPIFTPEQAAQIRDEMHPAVYFRLLDRVMDLSRLGKLTEKEGNV